MHTDATTPRTPGGSAKNCRTDVADGSTTGSVARGCGGSRIPNIFHFCFGFTPDFGGKPFSLVHYLAVKSAHEVNKPDMMHFYHKYEPTG